MALTLDTIVNKVFTPVGNNGAYDRNEVDDFLDEILAEMETREAKTMELEKKNNGLLEKIDILEKQLKEAQSTAKAPANIDNHSSESFELVLSKARTVYDDIVAEAKAKSSSIIAEANEEAANIRANSQKQITDLADRLASMRRQTSEYYEQLSKIIEKQNDSLGDLKRLM